MRKKTQCGKWKHDFSYEGKKKHSEVGCRKCGKNMVEWTNEMVAYYDEKLYGIVPSKPECSKWDHDFPHGECEDDYKIKCKKCDKTLGDWCDERVKENWNVW